MRFTVWRLMVGVALLAVLMATTIWGFRISPRGSVYRRNAELTGIHEANERFQAERFASNADSFAREIPRLDQRIWLERGAARESLMKGKDDLERKVEKLRSDAKHSYRRAAHFGLLRRKYETAARSPWLPVEPDPPGPF
jgi:hypothetical protein